MMTSLFVQHLEARGVTLTLRGDRFVARGASTLVAWTRQALVAHRAELLAFLRDGVDVDLKPNAARAALKKLGFVFVPEVRAFIHPLGDAVGDAVLMGFLAPDEVAPNPRDINAPPLRPRAVEADVTEVYPGRIRWSEQEGVLTKDPFPHLERIDL